MAEPLLPAFARAEAGATLLFLRLTPKGGRDAVEGALALGDGRVVLAARVRALPEDGAANEALLKLLAKKLGLPVSSLSIVAGATARLKTIRIARAGGEIAAGLAGLANGPG